MVCFEILVGLEGYFDTFFPHIVEKHYLEAKKIIQNILAERDIFLKCMKFREKGEFIPNSLIKTMESIQNDI